MVSMENLESAPGAPIVWLAGESSWVWKTRGYGNCLEQSHLHTTGRRKEEDLYNTVTHLPAAMVAKDNCPVNAVGSRPQLSKTRKNDQEGIDTAGWLIFVNKSAWRDFQDKPG